MSFLWFSNKNLSISPDAVFECDRCERKRNRIRKGRKIIFIMESIWNFYARTGKFDMFASIIGGREEARLHLWGRGGFEFLISYGSARCDYGEHGRIH